MALSGSLAEFSLPEVFQILEQGQKTGRLILTTRQLSGGHKEDTTYIWLRAGHIIAVADRIDNQGLVTIIAQRGWLTSRFAVTVAENYTANTPMGLYLKAQKLIQPEQLKLLFSVQVTQPICKLFSLSEGGFNFQESSQLPLAEMTGLSAPASEVTLAGLRALKDWTALEDKLPDTTSTLIQPTSNPSTLTLYQLETQVWQWADGQTTLEEMAKQADTSVDKIQRVAFRLSVIGLVEEVPVAEVNPIQTPVLPPEDDEDDLEIALPINKSPLPIASENKLSQGFLQNLMGFLRGKVS